MYAEIRGWKGLPRTIFYFKNMCRNKGIEGAASSHLLEPKNGRNGGMEGAASNHILLQKYVQK